MSQGHVEEEWCGCDECIENEKAVSNSPSVGEIKAFTPMQARGFIVGNITLKLNQLGLPAEQACEMANIILTKAGE